MNKPSFLLEIGTEEIPARFMAPALAQLQKNAAAFLLEARLVHGEIEVLGTPRRLSLLVRELADRQPDLEETKKGPAKKAAFDAEGLPTNAAKGFARSQGVDVTELFTDRVDGVEYVFAVRKEAGQATMAILPALCERLIRSLAFPKPMFWYSKDIRFARPVRWLAALYGKEVVPFTFAGLPSGNQTQGHRFLAPGPAVLEDADAYPETMDRHYVMADPDVRRRAIEQQVRQAAEALGGRTVVDEDLLEEVANLVEYPKAVVGNFAPEFLAVPPEVLITAMRAHQRYFPVFDNNDVLLPHFIAVSNGTRDEYLGNVRAGNERVLRARLADARFFFDEDRKQPLPQYVEALENIVFMEPLGTMRQKTERIVQLASLLARDAGLSPQEQEAAQRAALLAKADLMTHMVYEFPELQGIMGMHYARLSGEPEAVALAIEEHYAPRHAGDLPPRTLPGAMVAIADKMDTLAACFGLGLIPSGSQDPYALRRSALGVVATLMAHGFAIELKSICLAALGGLAGAISRDTAAVAAEMEDFLLQRVRFLFAERGLRYDVIDAALATPGHLPALWSRATLLQQKLDTPELTRILTPYTRAANLTRGQSGLQVRPALLEAPAEAALYQAAQEAASRLEPFLEKNDFADVFAALAPLHAPIDRFFSEVMVMVEDEAVRENRLALLLYVRELFLALGDLSKIVQEKK
jgi:glycyl-tRNA synthetase beta chain